MRRFVDDCELCVGISKAPDWTPGVALNMARESSEPARDRVSRATDGAGATFAH